MANTNATIYIIGAGAIGRALAVFLSQHAQQVTLLRGHISTAAEHHENITVELSSGEMLSASVRVSAIDNYSTLDGIIVLATKSYGNHAIASALKDRTGNSPIVVMQNGLNVEMPFLEHGFPGIYRCVLFASSQYAENGTLRFKPAAHSPIGIIKGTDVGLAQVIGLLSNPHLIFEPEQDIQPVIWTKAIINCVFNSICPLLETDNGIFYRSEQALHIAKQVIDECVAVALNENITLDAARVLERLLLISRTSKGQLISTYQDILNKRRTEIETFNFAISEIAGKLKKTDSIQRTRILGDLIRIKSEIKMAGGVNTS